MKFSGLDCLFRTAVFCRKRGFYMELEDKIMSVALNLGCERAKQRLLSM